MTPTAHTSPECRWAIIAHWKALGDLKAVSSTLGVRLRVVRRWVKRYQATGYVDDAPKSGRPRLLTRPAAARALELLVNQREAGSKIVATMLHAKGLTSDLMHRTTIARAVHTAAGEAGQKLVVLRGKPQKLLSAATKHKRLEFSKANLSRGWGNVMFSDRKKFPFSYPGFKVHPITWALKGSKREASTVNHAQVVNVYCGITKYGLTDFHIVAGTSRHQTSYSNKKGHKARNITSDEYASVVKQTFLPQGRRIFTSHGVSSWVLQQDNDPTHKAAIPVVHEWNASHASSVSILQNWPPTSPDLNPIENFWSYLQAKMDSKGCQTFTEYQAALIQEAKATPTAYFSKLVGSMGNRLAECIKKGGDKTRY
jgi:hypothetical protein